MSSEDKKNYSETFKNYVIAVSIVVGGFWAAYVFNARLEVELAKSQLEKSNLELLQRPVLVGSIRIEISSTDSQKQWLLKGIVKIENKGNTDVQIITNQQSFRVAEVKLENGVVASFGERRYVGERATEYSGKTSGFTPIFAKNILAGQVKELAYLVEVNKPGIYMVEFIGEPGKALLDVRDTIRETIGVDKFTVRDFIVVGNGPNKAFQPTAKRGG